MNIYQLENFIEENVSRCIDGEKTELYLTVEKFLKKKYGGRKTKNSLFISEIGVDIILEEMVKLQSKCVGDFKFRGKKEFVDPVQYYLDKYNKLM